MRPHTVARYVTLGLTEKDTGKAGVVLPHPLSIHEVGVEDEWGIYAVDLSAFPAGSPTQRLNWHKVAGMRVVRVAGEGVLQEITFKNILFEM
jgi:hypothetical protein